MNWGYKIILVFAVFVSGILYMVYSSFNHNIDLVSTNYYEEELKYQNVIDAMERANGLSAKPICEVKDDSLHVQFPPEMKQRELKVVLWLYFIADKKRDIKQKIVTTNGRIAVPLTRLNKGMHDVKVSWEVEGAQYYFEQKLLIP